MRRVVSSCPSRLVCTAVSLFVVLALSAATGRNYIGAAIADGGAAEIRQAAPYWVELPADRPLAAHAAIEDLQAQRMVLHGGERDATGQPAGDMRRLDLSTDNGLWSDVATTGVAPRSRLDGRGLQGSRAVVDEYERIALVVCDCRNGSTHLFDLASNRWSRAPADRPIAVWNYIMVYDPEGDRAILYGGDERGDNELTNEGWSYDLSPSRRGWRRLPRAPFRNLFQATGYDDVSGHWLVFSGLDPRLSAVSDLWRLDLARADEDDAWENVSDLVTGVSPTPRGGATLTFIPGTSQALLYGGYSNGDKSDLWLLDYTDPDRPTWSELTVGGPTPGLRSAHSAVWDETNERLVVYGGIHGYTYMDDTWALYPQLGAVPTPTTSSPPDTITSTPTAAPSETPTESPTSTPTPERVLIHLPIAYRPQLTTPSASQTPPGQSPAESARSGPPAARK